MTDYERIENVILYLDRRYREQPSLEQLARVAGLSESHFHRLFSRWAGTTPKSFLKHLTISHARALLAQSKDLLGVSLEVGLSGPSRLHDLLVSVDAVTPGEFKSGGEGIEIRYGFHATPFGECLIGLTRRGICHLVFVDSRARARALSELSERWPNARLLEDAKGTLSSVTRAFGGQGKARLLLRGTPFQLKVWNALLGIPPGGVASYGDLARLAGSPGSARAVGSALASNSIAYLIPCHRVIRETGMTGEYRWKPARKRAILAWESTGA